MGPSSSVGLFSIRHTHTHTHGPNNTKRKPQNTIRIPTSQSVRLGLFRGRLVSGVFVLLYRRSLVSSSSRGRRFFRPQLDTLPVGSSPTSHGGRLFFVSVFQRYPTRTIVVSTTRHTHTQYYSRPASRSKDGMDATDHTITSSQPQRRLPIFCLLQVYKELKKLPVFFLPFVLI